MSVASKASTPTQFVLDRSGREGSVAGSGDGASDPGASAPPNHPPVPDPTDRIHPPPSGFHGPVDPPWGRPVDPVEPVEPESVPPSAPAVAVGFVVGEPPVLPLSLAALANGGSESPTRTDSPHTRARTKFALKADVDALKADVEVCAATQSCFLLAPDARPPPAPP